jgi:tryptophan synthase alpha chain
MSRITDKFLELSKKNEGALIIYTMAGDPSIERMTEILSVIAEHADIIEIGIPFSDSIADGPTIQAAADRALRGGMTPEKTFNILSDFRKESELPTAILTYYNIVLQRGTERFMKDLSDAGVDGIIIPDLPFEESHELADLARRYGIDLIPLIAPTSPPERIEKISENASGFLYLVSILGVTGARERLSEYIKDYTSKVSEITHGEIPIAVGFGLSKPEHIREVLKYADGAIVGSAVVSIIDAFKHNPDGLLSEMNLLLANLKAATR